MPHSSAISQDVEARYHAAAVEYLQYLNAQGPESFMEGTPQAHQRTITVASFAVVAERMPGVQMFNDLLIQFADEEEIQRAVPDNMVVVHPTPLPHMLSFNHPTQAAQGIRPLIVFEYVSRSDPNKDYEECFEIYQHLRIPFYLIFDIYADGGPTLSLFRINTRRRYSPVRANAEGRFPIPPLEVEVALVEGWARFWFRSELVPLPGELVQQLDRVRAERDQERARAEQESKRAEQQRQRANKEEEARLKAEQELTRLRELLRQHGIEPTE